MNRRIDVFDNVRQLEQCKADLLLSVAQLYRTLSTMENVEKNEIGEQLAEVIALAYAVGGRLGWEQEELAKKAYRNIRLRMLEENPAP